MTLSEVITITMALARLFPEDSYGLVKELYNDGIRSGIITQEEYNAAQQYYGVRWNHANSTI